MKKLNLGCGSCFDFDWVNLDYIKSNENIIECDLNKGIPYNNNEIDIIYHSHLLEHFSKPNGIEFLRECYRVLKPGGIIRVVVPDLERIATEYLKNLRGALKGDPISIHNYNWIMLELYDQTVRNSSGGEMAEYLAREDIPNMDYVLSRIGDEGKGLHNNYLNHMKNNINKQKSLIQSLLKVIKRVNQIPRTFLKETLFKKEKELLRKEIKALNIGRFRLSGEIHQWMYDQYSLTELLKSVGFKEVKIVSAFSSSIPDWNKYQLDVKDGLVRKPDSLFLEALK